MYRMILIITGGSYKPIQKIKSFVKRTLAGLMLSGSTHAPSGPIWDRK